MTDIINNLLDKLLDATTQRARLEARIAALDEEKYQSDREAQRLRIENNDLKRRPTSLSGVFGVGELVSLMNAALVVPGQDYSHKIRAIKAVRAVTGWGLKESKDFVETKGAKLPEGVVP